MGTLVARPEPQLLPGAGACHSPSGRGREDVGRSQGEPGEAATRHLLGAKHKSESLRRGCQMHLMPASPGGPQKGKDCEMHDLDSLSMTLNVFIEALELLDRVRKASSPRCPHVTAVSPPRRAACWPERPLALPAWLRLPCAGPSGPVRVLLSATPCPVAAGLPGHVGRALRADIASTFTRLLFLLSLLCQKR